MNSLLTSIFSPHKPAAPVSPTRCTPERSPEREIPERSALKSPTKSRRVFSLWSSHNANEVRKSVSFELPNDDSLVEDNTTKDQIPEIEIQPHAPEDDTEENTDDDDDDDDDRQYVIKRLKDHRWDDDSMQVLVEWEKGKPTWEPESNIHLDAYSTLLEYWEQVGRRPENPQNPDVFEVARIIKSTRDGKKLYVEWVGYGPKERTWEPRKAIQEAAPEAVAAFFKMKRAQMKKPTRMTKARR